MKKQSAADSQQSTNLLIGMNNGIGLMFFFLDLQGSFYLDCRLNLVDCRLNLVDSFEESPGPKAHCPLPDSFHAGG